MAFRDFPSHGQGIELLQRSLDRGRLGHAYLFSGDDLGSLEAIAVTLAKTLNCLAPLRGKSGAAIDCCDTCLSCRKIANGNHADIHWVRPESKLRVILIDQMRELSQTINLKATEAQHKVAVIVGADRLNTQAANAFLKTLEEPPPGSILVLLTTEPQRILETIISRCLRLSFGGAGLRPTTAADMEWLRAFSNAAATPSKSLLGRYRLMDILLQRLGALRESIQTQTEERSPLNQHTEVEKSLRDKWESELTASVESEYRRQRADLLLVLQWWLRDIWLRTVLPGDSQAADIYSFPDLTGTSDIAKRISTAQAKENLQALEKLQRMLQTNVQEALSVEVAFLKLSF